MKRKIQFKIIWYVTFCFVFSFNSNGQTIKGHTLGQKAVESEFRTTLGGTEGTMSLSVMDNDILGSIGFEAYDVSKVQVDLIINGLSKHLSIKLTKGVYGFDYEYQYKYHDKFRVVLYGDYNEYLFVSIDTNDYKDYLRKTYLKSLKEIKKLTEDDF